MCIKNKIVAIIYKNLWTSRTSGLPYTEQTSSVEHINTNYVLSRACIHDINFKICFVKRITDLLKYTSFLLINLAMDYCWMEWGTS